MEFGIVVFAIFLTAVAGFSTYSVWHPGNGRKVARHADHDANVLGKVKRTDAEQMARLVESLSEDDIIELETLLLANQDERTN